MPTNGKTVDLVMSAIESLAEKARTDKRLEEALLTMLCPLSDTIVSAFEKYAEEVRVLESEVGPERAWMLIEAHDDLIDLTSEERAAQVEAAKRLARAMILPKLGPVAKASLKQEAKAVRIDPEEYLRGIVFPDGLILAIGEMSTPQTIRLGRKWILDGNGKIAEVRPVYDLSVEKFVHWLYQEASQATDFVLSNRTYPDDPLNAIRRPKKDSVSCEDEIDEAAIERPDLVVALFNMDFDPIQSEIIAAQSIQEAKRQVSTLLRRGTPKEQALIKDALERDGDLSDLLREQGHSPEASRQKRLRLRRKLPE